MQNPVSQLGYVVTQGIWLQERVACEKARFFFLFSLSRYGYRILNISLVLPSIFKKENEMSLILGHHFHCFSIVFCMFYLYICKLYGWPGLLTG